eukprot:4956045-Karenia_brevis.AAC.1
MRPSLCSICRASIVCPVFSQQLHADVWPFACSLLDDSAFLDLGVTSPQTEDFSVAPQFAWCAPFYRAS